MNNPQNFRLQLLVIGARKCATTWLHRNLDLNPAFAFSPKVKESGFFSRYFDRGVDWYQSLFDSTGNGLNAEIDTSLMCSADAPENVHSLYPDIKIVALVRKPLDHFRSSYLHARRKGDIRATASEAWRTHQVFKDEVHFDLHLARWLDYFSKDQILIIYYEEIQRSPAEVISAISRFVGVAPVVDDSVLVEKLNVARSSRYKWLTRAIVQTARLMRRFGIHWMVNWIKSVFPQAVLYRDKVDEFCLDKDIEKEVRVIEDQQIKFLGNCLTVGSATLWKDGV